MKTKRISQLVLGLILGVSSAVSINAQQQPEFFKKLSQAALERTLAPVTYDPAYFSIDYPNGDIPAHKGVCTDVVIRAYRQLDIDLQQLVHRDMKAHFRAYPQLWGLTAPDPNIDHRRVPNLMTYFQRRGASLGISESPKDYQPGDLVTWDLARGLKHIGVVTHKVAPNGNPLIVHNIGSGPRLEDVLFSYTITGHYRYMGN